jgi:hypothetical protein
MWSHDGRASGDYASDFCCAPVVAPGKPYCAHHREICLEPPRFISGPKKGHGYVRVRPKEEEPVGIDGESV